MSAVDDYLATVTPGQRAEFQRICDIVRRIVPSVEDGVSYGVPALKYKGRPIIGFVAAKKHLSIYPFSGKVIDRLRDRLCNYHLTSGSIHLSEENPIAESLLGEIVAARLQEIEARGPAV